MRTIDLHAHTDHSDGTLDPRSLVRAAATAGLDALAITDHDVTSALAEGMDEGRRVGVEVLVGCEISTRDGDALVHVLAWAFDPDDAALQAFLTEVRASRDRRNERMLERLAELDCPLEMTEVAEHAAGEIVARPHFARAMVDRGYVPDLRSAFDRYLADDAPGFVLADLPSPEAAVRAVRTAGGVTAVAHPRQIGFEGHAAWKAFFSRLKSSGLTGIEVDHPSHKPHHRERFRKLAEQLDLVATGGSDFHGANKPYLQLGVGDGTIHVTGETWARLMERRGR